MEMTINLHVTGLESLAQALLAFSTHRGTPAPAEAVPPPQVAQTAPTQTPPPAVNSAVPVQAAPPMNNAMPMQAPPVMNTAAPTPAAPIAPPAGYTLEQLARACGPLMDAGKGAELQGMLAQLGVQSLQQLRPEQYGTVATALRGMGAQI